MSNQKQIYISKENAKDFNEAISILEQSGFEQSFSAIVVKAVIEAAKRLGPKTCINCGFRSSKLCREDQ